MNAKAILVMCAAALFIQSAAGRCCGHRWDAGFSSCGAGLDKEVLGAGIGLARGLSASHGGGLGVATASAVPTVGLAVASENAYEGCVGVGGNLPFLGTAAVEGVFPTAGAGAITYGCGDGVVGITAEGPMGASLGFGARVGHGRGYGGCGCGCGSRWI